MDMSVSAQCRACIATLKTIISILSNPTKLKGRIYHEQVIDELERFSLWMGNIGVLHQLGSSMSLESRLSEANDVLNYILELIDDLNVATRDLLEIVSGEREGEIASMDDGEENQNEETELLEDIRACITHLFKVSSLVRQAAPADLFAKALSRHRYHFNDQFDIAHVGEKYPKLATEELVWLRKRLGQAITQRRHYLRYIQDHRDKLGGMDTQDETAAPTKQLPILTTHPDSSDRPSTFFTKASSLTPDQITPQMLLSTEGKSDSENNARSCTTITRSFGGDLDTSAAIRIPKLDELQIGTKKEVECPYCFQVKKFKNERAWRRHIFSDLRCYICTFPSCDAPYFSDINEWFRHEMQNHRISYTCQLCQDKTFQFKEHYLAHVQRKHPNLLENSEEQLVLKIAQRPLDKICAQDCPCCSTWLDRLKERAVTGENSSSAEAIIYVDPTVFKRHLASHLEQLALFAIPIRPAADDDVISNAAIKENEMAFLDRSDLSASPLDNSSTTNVDTQEAVIYRLSSFFPEGEDSRKSYTESEFSEISSLLKRSHPQWSKVPRIYTVLRTIGHLSYLDDLIQAGFSDIWFPVTERSLPDFLSPSVRVSFVNAQRIVLTKSLDLERGWHYDFEQQELVPFEQKGILDNSGFGQIERVLSTTSFKEYARKRVPRSVTFRGQQKESTKLFIAEIQTYKRLKHHHIVQIVGSYTDPKYIGIIMLPVAEMDLDVYLSRATVSNHAELRTFFGCLATALKFMHGQRVKHRDIQPSNIVVHHGCVLFTGFTLPINYIGAAGSTTKDIGDIITPKYCAPEVASYGPRNTMSDIWSLGVVYMEMVVVLKGKAVQDMYDFLREHGSKQSYIHMNKIAFSDFVAELSLLGKLSDNRVLGWAEQMLSTERQMRPTASSLVSLITTIDKEEDRDFCGICCIPSEEDFSDWEDE